jgi:hypothetical protein
VTASELYAEAVTLREKENLWTSTAIITVGRKSHLLWLSKGEFLDENIINE